MRSIAVLAGAALALGICADSSSAQYTPNPQTPTSPTSASLSARLIDQQTKSMQRAATVEVSVTGVQLVDPGTTGEAVTAGQGHLHYQVDNGPIIATTATKLSFHELSPGTHTITVMLADNAHKPLGPRQTLSVAAGTQSTSTAGQQPYPTQSQTPTQTQSSTTTAATRAPATTTIAGCVYRERDVPGRTPNVAERAGILEDYILAEVRTPGEQARAATTPAPTGTSGAGSPMYKLEHAADEKLRALVGKRVEVTGRIDAEPGDTATRRPQPDTNVSPDRIELPEFEVTSIREIAGTCPATPTMPRR
jgi:hypothetical protein